MTTVKQTILDLEKALLNIGVDNNDIKIVHSETNFGKSSYLYVNGLKVRSSDHSTGSTRLLEEYHIGYINFNDIVLQLEIRLFPGRFEQKEILVYGDAHERTENAMQNCAYEYIIHGERIGKKGNKIYNVSLKNKIEIINIRKQ